jgi:hypothetical protein
MSTVGAISSLDHAPLSVDDEIQGEIGGSHNGCSRLPLTTIAIRVGLASVAATYVHRHGDLVPVPSLRATPDDKPERADAEPRGHSCRDRSGAAVPTAPTPRRCGICPWLRAAKAGR